MLDIVDALVTIQAIVLCRWFHGLLWVDVFFFFLGGDFFLGVRPPRSFCPCCRLRPTACSFTSRTDDTTTLTVTDSCPSNSGTDRGNYQGRIAPQEGLQLRDEAGHGRTSSSRRGRDRSGRTDNSVKMFFGTDRRPS